LKLAFPKPKKSKRKAWTRDEEATAKWNFFSKKSFAHKNTHIYVYGEQDHLKMRILIFLNAGGTLTVIEGKILTSQPAMCQACTPSHEVRWEDGDWMHPKSTGGRRCDGPCCGRFGCKKGHAKEHNRELRFRSGSRAE
jgi:hypothetical protein